MVGDYIASLGWYGTVREVIMGVAAAARLSGIKQGYPGPGFVSQGQCYKTFYVRILLMFVISHSVCHKQAFPAKPNICEKDWSLPKLST